MWKMGYLAYLLRAWLGTRSTSLFTELRSLILYLRPLIIAHPLLFFRLRLADTEEATWRRRDRKAKHVTVCRLQVITNLAALVQMVVWDSVTLLPSRLELPNGRRHSSWPSFDDRAPVQCLCCPRPRSPCHPLPPPLTPSTLHLNA